MLTRKTAIKKRRQRTKHNPIIQNQFEAQQFCRVQQWLADSYRFGHGNY